MQIRAARPTSGCFPIACRVMRRCLTTRNAIVSANFGAAKISATPGMNAKQMMEAAASGKLKALYVVGANPVKTFGAKKADKLGGLDLLIVQDLFLTETALRADVFLPA